MNQTSKEKRLQVVDDNLGMVPPQVIDMEEAVLGAVMLEKKAYGKIADLINSDDFYKPTHQEIFKSVEILSEKQVQADLLLVCKNLQERGKLEFVGGRYLVTDLTSKVNSAAHIEQHAAKIKEASVKRKLIELSLSLQASAFDDLNDPFDLLDETNQRLHDIQKFSRSKPVKTYHELLYKEVGSITNYVNSNEIDDSMLPTGYVNMDKVVGYWIPQDLIIIAARPGMGKSALALNLCENQAKLKTPSAFISLEMGEKGLLHRGMSGATGLPISKFRYKRIDANELIFITNKVADISGYDIYIIDDCHSLQAITTKARILVEEHGVKFIVIDYLQLVKAGKIEGNKNMNREQEISYISRNIKLLAKELDVPIVALSQLSRAVESRPGDKRPKLSDLRESGSLEQDADIVCFVYRPEYYGIKEDEHGEALIEGYTEIICAKHRNGSLDRALLRFIGKTTSFENYDKHSFENKLHSDHPTPSF